MTKTTRTPPLPTEEHVMTPKRKSCPIEHAEKNLDPYVPQDIRRFVLAFVDVYGVLGTSDPMWIANVVAQELGRGDGAGSFRSRPALASEPALDRCWKRLCVFPGSKHNGVEDQTVRRLLTEHIDVEKTREERIAEATSVAAKTLECLLNGSDIQTKLWKRFKYGDYVDDRVCTGDGEVIREAIDNVTGTAATALQGLMIEEEKNSV